jgi:hypothetical protein
MVHFQLVFPIFCLQVPDIESPKIERGWGWGVSRASYLLFWFPPMPHKSAYPGYWGQGGHPGNLLLPAVLWTGRECWVGQAESVELDRQRVLSWTCRECWVGQAESVELDRQRVLSWTGRECWVVQAESFELDRQRVLSWTGRDCLVGQAESVELDRQRLLRGNGR